uniref:Uncharacterized protein n=1 Tax=Cacopsylla melanoneura TaxID=428564 RepID=A0A8D8QHM4_9HEMI
MSFKMIHPVILKRYPHFQSYLNISPLSLVVQIRPQKDICPQRNTYPMKGENQPFPGYDICLLRKFRPDRMRTVDFFCVLFFRKHDLIFLGYLPTYQDFVFFPSRCFLPLEIMTTRVEKQGKN